MANKSRAKHYIKNDSGNSDAGALWDARTAKEPNHDDEFVRNADHVGRDLHLPAAGPIRAPYRRYRAGRECAVAARRQVGIRQRMVPRRSDPGRQRAQELTRALAVASASDSMA